MTYKKPTFLSTLSLLFILLNTGCEADKAPIKLSAKLIPIQGASYTNIALCKPQEKLSDPFFHPVQSNASNIALNHDCTNDQCNVELITYTTGKVPKTITMYIKQSDGSCQKSEVSTQGHISIVHYSAEINIPRENYVAWEAKGSLDDIESEKGQWQGNSLTMDKATITIVYDTPPSSDIISMKLSKKIALSFN